MEQQQPIKMNAKASFVLLYFCFARNSRTPRRLNYVVDLKREKKRKEMIQKE